MMNKTLAVVAVLCGCVSLAFAQQTLPDLLQEGDVEWMIGSWSAQNQDGNTVSVSYQWDLDKHVILSHLKMPEYEAKSMIAVDPDSGNVKSYGVNNRGGVSIGEWTAEDGKAIFKFQAKRPGGRNIKAAAVHERLGPDSARVEIFGLDDYGDLVQPARFSVTLHRKK